MRSSAVKKGRGFSLIELLVVMVIIAILVLVAIPAISNYRANARIAAVQSDLRNAATAVESSYLTTGSYPAPGTVSTAAAPTFSRPSAGVTLTVVTSVGDQLCIDGVHSGVSGSAGLFYYASGDGTATDNVGTIQRGVHAGTCGGGSGGTQSGGSAAAPTVPAQTVADAPTAVTATAGNALASLSWTATATAGAAAVTDYEVTASPASGAATTRLVGSAATTYSFTGLVNGTTYSFTVKAVNSVGKSAASAASNAVTPAAPVSTTTAAAVVPITVKSGEVAYSGFYASELLPDGSYYTVEYASGRVRKVSTSGVASILTTLGTSVRSTAVASDGSLLVSAFGANKVVRVTSAGVVSDFATINGPYAVVVAPGSGDVYVAGYTQGAVRRYTSSGTLVSSYTITNPLSVAFYNGDVYIGTGSTTANSGVISRYTGGATTNPTVFASGNGMKTPYAIAFAVDGTAYVADYEAHRLWKVSANGSTVTAMMSGTSVSPTDVFFGPDGSLYYTDYDLNQLKVVRP